MSKNKHNIYLVELPSICLCIFFVLQVISMFYYPGGTFLNFDTEEYSFTRNFLSDLGRSVSFMTTSTIIWPQFRYLNYDYYFVYANGRAYEKGRDEQQEIERLVKEIDTSDGSKDALKLYRKYLRQNESVDDKEKKRTKAEKEEDEECAEIDLRRGSFGWRVDWVRPGR